MTKEFLHLAPSPEQCLVPLTNFEVADDACEFRQIPVALVIPSQLPPELRGRGSAFRVKVPEGCPMLSAAVFKGTWLSVSSLQSIASSLKDMPAIPKGTGSGVAGRVKKIDLAVQLVKHLFEDSSEEEQLRMVKGIMYQNSGSLTEKDEDILLYLEQLDSENQQAFEQVKRFAKEERTENEKMELDLIKKKLRAQRAAEKRLEQEKAEERKEDGPSSLRSGPGSLQHNHAKTKVMREGPRGLTSHPKNSRTCFLWRLRGLCNTSTTLPTRCSECPIQIATCQVSIQYFFGCSAY